MKVLGALRGRHGSSSIMQLAGETGLDPSDVLDHCELLLTADLVDLDPTGKRFFAVDE